MGYKGLYDIFRCDACGTETHVPHGYDISRWPIGTNQTWTYEHWGHRQTVTCPDCKGSARSLNEEV